MKLNKKFQLAAVGITLIAVMAIFLLNSSTIFSQKPPVPPPVGVDTNGDGIPDTQISFSIFQALRVVYPDGTDSWKYPNSRTTLPPYSITDVDTNKVISMTQAYLYFNLASSKAVSLAQFRGYIKLEVYNSNKQLVSVLSDTDVIQDISMWQNATDNYIISSTITASALESLIDPQAILAGTDVYYVITCYSFGARVTFADGTFKDFLATGVQATENQMWWHLKVSNTGPWLQITSLGVEWKWI